MKEECLSLVSHPSFYLNNATCTLYLLSCTVLSLSSMFSCRGHVGKKKWMSKKGLIINIDIWISLKIGFVKDLLLSFNLFRASRTSKVNNFLLYGQFLERNCVMRSHLNRLGIVLSHTTKNILAWISIKVKQ